MQKTGYRDWMSHRHQLMTNAVQTTSEPGNWRHLLTSFGHCPYSETFDSNCFRYQPHLGPPPSYAEQFRRQWMIANYVSYHRLKQLEGRSPDGDEMLAPRRDVTPVNKEITSSNRDETTASVEHTEAREQHLSNGSRDRLYVLLFIH